MEEHEYKYAGQPLTPGIAAELILELFSGRIAERHKIVDAVVRTHRERSGLDARAKDTPRVVKKALSNIESAGLAENPSFGQWKIKIQNPGMVIVSPIEIQSDEMLPSVPAPEVIIGEGDNSVYLYYFENYRKLADIEGRQEFPCKIGRSERDPILRVLSQSSTALPEVPTIARLFKTNDGSALETAIHAILSLRGKEIEDSPGTEWFLTSPDEVDAIVRFVNEQQRKA
ncbi:MAG: GIY-YIG nuclease family protein [Kiritimatiellales bacterium]